MRLLGRMSWLRRRQASGMPAGFLLGACLVLLLAISSAPLRADTPSGAPPAAEGPAGTQSAAGQPAAQQPAKIRELLDLLADPQIRAWIAAEQAAKAPAAGTAPPQGAAGSLVSQRLAAVRAHLRSLAQTIPQLPEQFRRAGATLSTELEGRGPIQVILLLAVFLGLGFGAGWVYLRGTRRLRERSAGLPMATVPQRLLALVARLLYGLGLVAVIGLGSIGALLAIDWPPLLREILLSYLIAFLALCLALILGRFLLAPGARDFEDMDRFRILPMPRQAARFWYRRLGLLAGWFAFGYATVMLLDELGFDVDARRLVAYLLGIGLLVIGLEMVWHLPGAPAAEGGAPRTRRRLGTWAMSAYLALLWLLWVASALPLFWLLVMLGAVPWVMGGVQRAVAQILRPAGSAEAASAAPSILAVCLQRGMRAVIIIGAALILAQKWNVDLVALTSSDTVATRLARGLLSTVVIALVADFGWQIAKAAIDRKIAEAPANTDQNSEEWRRHARLRTLLPIFRNLLFIVLLVMVALMALAAVGVDIGPLVAGASVVGVAIGFGAQTLVKDIISGMFYLLDDAFRVGEYIQSGNYKGTVESFSLRSVKLRHHRGPLYTVPFGVLGAIQNMSRDWVIDKLSVGITYDSDMGKVKKIIKQIGKELLEDPELGPKFLEPLKMQGIEQFGDFAIQIRMKMMTRPGEQFTIRRQAYAMIKKAFDANGIEFAFPTVQVAGGTDAAVAAAAHQSLTPPPVAEA
jgi:moderate conductance mechanosensitive channel